MKAAMQENEARKADDEGFSSKTDKGTWKIYYVLQK